MLQCARTGRTSTHGHESSISFGQGQGKGDGMERMAIFRDQPPPEVVGTVRGVVPDYKHIQRHGARDWQIMIYTYRVVMDSSRWPWLSDV